MRATISGAPMGPRRMGASQMTRLAEQVLSVSKEETPWPTTVTLHRS